MAARAHSTSAPTWNMRRSSLCETPGNLRNCTMVAILSSGIAELICLLTPLKRNGGYSKGEDAAVAAYVEGQHAGIASDDKRFTKKLRLLGIPYLTPAVLVLLLVRRGHLSVDEGANKLDALSPMVSDAETAIAKTKLDAMKHKVD